MKKNSNLGKQHFWILAGVAPVLIFIAFLIMWLSVSGEVKAQKKAYEDQKSALASNLTSAKSKGEVEALKKRVGVLESERVDLWKSNIDLQLTATEAADTNKKLFEWPTGNSAALRELEKQNFKFGDKFRVVGTVLDRETLGPAFEKGYAQIAGGIAPTRFASGSWTGALRHVNNWGTKSLDPSLFWLALEDFWVQRALLQPIIKMNKDSARFEDLTPATPESPLKRSFRNRIWELDLEVVQTGNKNSIKGTLRNRTNRLQVLGVNKAMKLKVWLDDPTGPQPDLEYTVRGEQVPGKGVLNASPQELTVSRIVKIARVEQVFDEATVPVRLINSLELGMLDHRNKGAVLEVPAHIEKEESTDPNAAPAPTVSTGPPGGRPGEEEGGRGNPYTTTGTSSGPAKVGDFNAVLGGNKKRYLKRTDDVRRMPVAVSVIIDNDFVNDLMVAFANSPLRFQITQTQWQRFKGQLPGTASGSSLTTTTPFGGGGGGDDEGVRGGSGAPVRPGGPPSGITGPMRPGAPGGATGPTFPSGPVSPSAPGSSQSNIPPEANEGLAEFAIFGVVSLYEKLAVEPKKDGEKTVEPAPMETPKPKDEKAPDPANPMGEKPKDPVVPMGEKPKDPVVPTDDKKKQP